VQYHLAVSPPPDPQAWRQVADPQVRLRQGLGELYAYFRRHEALLRNVVRDVALVLERLGGEAPEALGRFLALPGQWQAALAAGWPPAPLLEATIGLAVDFPTWHTLVRRQGLAETQARDLMVRLVACAAAVAPAPTASPEPPR
jgi:hypothetical protein